jgi:hypothetical protein
MEKKLISLYQSTKDNYFLTADDKETELYLQTVVSDAELVSLYSIPYISRSNVKDDPTLLEFYRNMLEKPSMNRAPDLNKLRHEHLETGIMESTVIAQVLVECFEIFYVKDVASGAILQGQDDVTRPARPVSHLVRMEMTVKTNKNASGSFRNVHGNWIITDIDDLLDGNLIV